MVLLGQREIRPHPLPVVPKQRYVAAGDAPPRIIRTARDAYGAVVHAVRSPHPEMAISLFAIDVEPEPAARFQRGVYAPEHGAQLPGAHDMVQRVEGRDYG